MSSLAQQFLEIGVGRAKAKTQLNATPGEHDALAILEIACHVCQKITPHLCDKNTSRPHASYGQVCLECGDEAEFVIIGR